MVSIRILDVTAARRYLRGLRSLCAEAAAATDLGVLMLALEIIGRQKATVSTLLQKLAPGRRKAALDSICWARMMVPDPGRSSTRPWRRPRMQGGASDFT